MACGWERISNDVEVGLRLGGGHGFFVKIKEALFCGSVGLLFDEFKVVLNGDKIWEWDLYLLLSLNINIAKSRLAAFADFFFSFFDTRKKVKRASEHDRVWQGIPCF